MKKTIKTALTAAMFAASLGAAASSANAAQISDADTVPDVDALVTATTGDVVCVYGPPEVMESLFGTDITTESEYPLRLEGEAVIDTTAQTTELQLAGTVAPFTTTCTTALIEEGVVVAETTTDEPVLPGEAPLPTEGDFDGDRSIDGRDLSRIKRYLLQQMQGDEPPLSYEELIAADVNQDGKIDKEDIRLLSRLLTGKPEDEEEAQTTTTLPDIMITDTTGTTTATTVQTVYGPPIWLE